MKKVTSLAMIGFWLFFLDSCFAASVNNGYQQSSTTASTTTTALPTTEHSTYTTHDTTATTPSPVNPGTPSYPGAPVWNPSLGAFIMGRNAPPKYDRSNNGTVPPPPPPQYMPPPMACPPCPCMQRPYVPIPRYPVPPMYPQPPAYMPPRQDDDDGHYVEDGGHRAQRSTDCPDEDPDCEGADEEINERRRRSTYDDYGYGRRVTNDDYWYGTGPANPNLLKVNMGYAAQMAIRDQISKYGPPLHMGTINGADFNFPDDFHAFEQDSFEPQPIRDNIVYELVGPIEVTPIGPLAGQIPNAPNAFTSLVLSQGNFRLLSIQKEGIMHIMKIDTNAVFAVDCNRQKFGGCQNLRPVRNTWDFPKFIPVLNQVYLVAGQLDTTPTEDSTATTTIVNGSFKITAILGRERFSMTNTVTNAVVFVNCRRQILPKTCESLRKA